MTRRVGLLPVAARRRAACFALTLAAVFGGGVTRLAAQEAVTTLDSWRFVRYTPREGLRSPLISALAESESGTVWVGTAAGVAWFDGWRWRPAHAQPDVLTRQASRVRPMPGDSMVVVMHNLLFVGDTSGFVQRPVIVNDKEEQVRDAAWGADGLYMIVNYGVSPDSAHLMRWRSGRAEPVTPPAPLQGREVPALHQGPAGSIWLNTASGLYHLQGGTWRLKIAASTPGAVRVPVLRETPDGHVLANVMGPLGETGTWIWKGDDAPRREASEGDDELLDGAADGEAGLLAVRRGGYLRQKLGDRWQDYRGSGFALSDARTVLRDRTGDLWVGTGQGLLLLRESSHLWGGVPHGFPSLRDRVNALLDLPNGDRWAGTADGLDIFHPDGRVQHVQEAAGVPLRTITTLARDAVGNIWVASGSDLEGALRWDGRSWKRFTARDGLGAPHVHRIVVAPTGAIWFLGVTAAAGAPEGSASTFVLDSGRFTPFGTAQGLPTSRVYDFVQAPDGTQWFGTTVGLSRRRGGEWTHWKARRGRSGTMAFKDTPIRVFTLDLDHDGRPWFGDANSDFAYGLGTVEADTLRFFGADHGLLSNLIRSVRVGPDGTVWAGTLNGLSALHDGTWYNFGTDRGLGFPQIWPILVNDSLVVMGTLGGGVRTLSIRELRPPAPRVFITTPAVGAALVNVAWNPLAWRGVLPSSLIETRFRVDSGDWSAWTTERSVIVPLEGGRHRFEVQAKGLYPPLDGPIARAEIDVAGPLITRPAFYLPLLALVLAVIALLVLGARRQRRDALVLRESEGRFRALAASTSEGIAIGVAGRIVEANDQMHQLLRVPPGSLKGRPLDTLVVAEPERPDEGEALPRTIRRDDGSEFPADVRDSALTYFGEPARVTAIHDLSEREAATRALRASEERFETMFRRSPTAITLSSWPEGKLVDVSEGFERLTGLERASSVGRTTSELELYHDPAQRAALLATLAADGRADSVALTLRRRDGTLRDVLGTYQRLELDGQPHVLGALTDITERRTLEAQLLQSQKMEAVGRLAGGVAHDFNNLLTVILGHTDMLKHSMERAEDREDVEEIRMAAQRAADLTRQLLTFARKQRIAPELLDLGEIVPRTQRMLARLLGERIVVESRIAADVPLVVMDAGQLEQVLVNLAVNARDAMPQGGHLTIEAKEVLLDEVYAREHAHVPAGRYALVALTDTGVGIPAEELPRIFEPFFTTKEVGQGTGLGLAICYGIVREAGGHIGVYSEVGKGTTVRVYLPARTAARRRSPVPEARALVGGSESILLVEDEALVRNLIERVLKSLGYRVATAGDHAQAMAALTALAEPPQLLISDIVLPGPGGPEIARAVRARVPGIPVLYISGYTERGANPTAVLDAPLLSKPFTPEQLATTVRAALDSTSAM